MKRFDDHRVDGEIYRASYARHAVQRLKCLFRLSSRIDIDLDLRVGKTKLGIGPRSPHLAENEMYHDVGKHRSIFFSFFARTSSRPFLGFFFFRRQVHTISNPLLCDRLRKEDDSSDYKRDAIILVPRIRPARQLSLSENDRTDVADDDG